MIILHFWSAFRKTDFCQYRLPWFWFYAALCCMILEENASKGTVLHRVDERLLLTSSNPSPDEAVGPVGRQPAFGGGRQPFRFFNPAGGAWTSEMWLSDPTASEPPPSSATKTAIFFSSGQLFTSEFFVRRNFLIFYRPGPRKNQNLENRFSSQVQYHSLSLFHLCQ